jgi:hypothetical protein
MSPGRHCKLRLRLLLTISRRYLHVAVVYMAYRAWAKLDGFLHPSARVPEEGRLIR